MLLEGLEDDSSELVLLDCALVQGVEILEVFFESKPIDLGGFLDHLEHAFHVLGDFWPLPCPDPGNVLDFGHVGEIVGLGVIEEIQISHFMSIVCDVELADGLILFSSELKAQGRQHLPELFG